MINKNQKSLFREITNENINNPKRIQYKMVDKKISKYNKLINIFDTLRKFKAENQLLKIRFKESQSLKNKILTNVISEITNQYNKQIEQLTKANQKMKDQMNKSTQKRNNEYKRILSILTQKQQQLALLEEKILGNNEQNKFSSELRGKTEKYQQQIQQLNIQINSLKIEIEIKNEQNKQLSYQLKKYKLFCLNQNSSKHQQNKQQQDKLYTNKQSKLKKINQSKDSPFANSKLNESSLNIKHKNSTKINIEDAREIKILKKINQTPQKSSRFKNPYSSNSKHIQSNEIYDRFRYNTNTRNSSITKKSISSSIERSNQSISKQFKNALKQYNRQKKSKVSYYYR